MSLPKQYQWLLHEGGPKMLLKALELYGVTEVVGPKHNPIILDWARETGLSSVYKADEIPWCGLFMAVIALRAGKKVPVNPLWALNWANFGASVSQPMLGDVLTFKRDGGGHVALYIGEDATAYHVIGGNQGNAVSITRIAKNRLYKAVRTPYNNQPANVRRIELSAQGSLSTNEA
jgi:uncharacterized protein (TIGR02594 family)